jgi:hypothetical protein
MEYDSGIRLILVLGLDGVGCCDQIDSGVGIGLSRGLGLDGFGC